VWNDFGLLAGDFVGKNKADNCNRLVDNLLFQQKLGCNMYFKILFLNYHQDIFLENWDIEP
jgi:hypothetical protein